MRRTALLSLASVALILGLAYGAAAGRPRPPAWPRALQIHYCWGHPSYSPLCPDEVLTLYQDGTWFLPGGTGEWSAGPLGSTLTLSVDMNTTQYDGTIQLDGCYLGSMTSGVPGGPTGLWGGCYVPYVP